MVSQLLAEDYGILKINWHSMIVSLCMFLNTLNDLNPDTLLTYDASGLIFSDLRSFLGPF